MNKVYPFTNENVASFNTIYDFSNAEVLSVIGSGDQCFSSMLFGAKEIELYDCNDLAWDFFVLKWYGITILNYEEFYDFFVAKTLNSQKYFQKIISYLPTDIANRLKQKYNRYKGLSYLLYTDIAELNYNNGRVIPYLEREKYYQLQSILRESNLPKFYLTDLAKLPELVANKSYDILLTSNIFNWMPMSAEPYGIKRYKELLNRFKCFEIQALYCWSISEFLKPELEKNGFEIRYVQSAKKLRLTNDAVISLRNK